MTELTALIVQRKRLLKKNVETIEEFEELQDKLNEIDFKIKILELK